MQRHTQSSDGPRPERPGTIDIVLVGSSDHDVLVGRQRPRHHRGAHGALEWMVDRDERGVGYAGAVLLLAMSEESRSSGPVVVATARLEVLRRDKGAERRAVLAYDWFTEAEPLPLAAILGRLDGEVAAYVEGRVHREWPLPLSVTAATHVHRAIGDLSPTLAQSLVARYVEPPLKYTDAEMHQAERRDRGRTALRLAGFGADRLPMEGETSRIGRDAARLDRAIKERDMLAHDAAVMPGWSDARPHLGWYAFQKEGRRLYVKNIDFSREETKTGGDLLYVRRNPDAVVAVQYKRLQESRGKWLYRDDGRLARQLDALERLDAQGGGSNSSTRHNDIRLSHHVGFVKFVDARPSYDGGGSFGLLEGCYVPAEYASRRIPLGRDGQKHSQPYDPRADRYLDAQTFARLVSGGWVGGGSALTAKFLDEYFPRLLSESSGETTWAVDVPAPAASPASRPARHAKKDGMLDFEVT